MFGMLAVYMTLCTVPPLVHGCGSHSAQKDISCISRCEYISRRILLVPICLLQRHPRHGIQPNPPHETMFQERYSEASQKLPSWSDVALRDVHKRRGYYETILINHGLILETGFYTYLWKSSIWEPAIRVQRCD